MAHRRAPNTQNSRSVEAAVRKMRLYIGSDRCPIKSSQKFYDSAYKAIESVARIHNLDFHDTWAQITSRAQTLGAIVPMPGKDY